MAETHILDDPEHWRDRADEIRSLAEQMSDAQTRRMLGGVADDYEKLAKRAEERRAGSIGVGVARLTGGD